MKFDGDLAAIHAYLCSDGYAITNPKSQKHKYYYIGLRNTNLVLLKDFQTRFYRFFGVKPIITDDGRAKIQNKEIYKKLTKAHNYYSDRWIMPKLNKNLLKIWLRAYFDCDGWVYVAKAKNRKIGLDSINYSGILQIKSALSKKFGIESLVKKRKDREIWSLGIYGKDNLTKFAKNIGFRHPRKDEKLKEAVKSYMNYSWIVPSSKKELAGFVQTKGRRSQKRGQIRFNSVLKKNFIRLKKALIRHGIASRISKERINGNGNKYYTLSIKISEADKLR